MVSESPHKLVIEFILSLALVSLVLNLFSVYSSISSYYYCSFVLLRVVTGI